MAHLNANEYDNDNDLQLANGHDVNKNLLENLLILTIGITRLILRPNKGVVQS